MQSSARRLCDVPRYMYKQSAHLYAFLSACLVGRYLYPSCYILFTLLFMLNFIGHPGKDLWANPANIEGRNVSTQK